MHYPLLIEAFSMSRSCLWAKICFNDEPEADLRKDKLAVITLKSGNRFF